MITVKEMKAGLCIYYHGSTRSDRTDENYADERDLVGKIVDIDQNNVHIQWAHESRIDNFALSIWDDDNEHAWINFTDFISEKEYLSKAIKYS